MKIQLAIEKPVTEQYPDVTVGGFLVNLEGLKDLDGETDEMMTAASRELIRRGCKIETLANEPRIAAWRDAFKRSGLKPSTFKSSVEQLARRVLRGDSIATPLPIVNLYCGVSTLHLAPLGGYDCASLPESRIVLRHVQPKMDRFTPLAGRREDMPLLPTVVVYAAGDEIICYGFNHRDSATTCLRANTRVALFCSEATTPVHQESAKSALSCLREFLTSNGAKAGEIGLINQVKSEIELLL